MGIDDDGVTEDDRRGGVAFGVGVEWDAPEKFAVFAGDADQGVGIEQDDLATPAMSAT